MLERYYYSVRRRSERCRLFPLEVRPRLGAQSVQKRLPVAAATVEPHRLPIFTDIRPSVRVARQPVEASPNATSGARGANVELCGAPLSGTPIRNRRPSAEGT